MALPSPPQTLVFAALLLLAACAPDWKPSHHADSGEAVVTDDMDGGDGEGGASDSDGAQAPETGLEGDGGAGDGGGSVEPLGTGECNAGALRCSEMGPAVEICTASSGWQTREPCGSVCTEGACRGDCHPGDKHCALNQTPETCDAAGQWVADAKCMFACTGQGECTGECTPGVKRCDPAAASVPQTCDETGQWVSGEACANVCSSGTCSGSCVPGQKKCGANQTPELCSPMGTWEPQTACPFVCGGAGECSGECVPGALDCDDQVRLSCDQDGRWKSGASCSDSACVAGNCVGRCAPGSVQCGANETPQTCSEQGDWQNGTRCPFVCTGAGSCSGQCPPNQKSCSGATLRTCRADGSGFTDMVCQPAQTGETASCSTSTLSCTSSCQASPGRCTGSNKCWSLPYGCEECIEPYVWRSIPSATGGDRICVTGVRRTEVKNENAQHSTHIETDPARQTFGPNTCLQGFVWRDAFANDQICVTPASRDTAKSEKATHFARTRVGANP